MTNDRRRWWGNVGRRRWGSLSGRLSLRRVISAHPVRTQLTARHCQAGCGCAAITQALVRIGLDPCLRSCVSCRNPLCTLVILLLLQLSPGFTAAADVFLVIDHVDLVGGDTAGDLVRVGGRWPGS